MLWVPERESYRIQIPKFLTLRGCFSWICSPGINSYPPHHCPSCSSAPYTHLVQADDLTVGLLDLAQLGEEVPETRLGDDIVWCKDTHAVELWGWVGVTWEMTANDLVLDQALVAGACRLNCWRTISALSDSRIGRSGIQCVSTISARAVHFDTDSAATNAVRSCREYSTWPYAQSSALQFCSGLCTIPSLFIQSARLVAQSQSRLRSKSAYPSAQCQHIMAHGGLLRHHLLLMFLPGLVIVVVNLKKDGRTEVFANRKSVGTSVPARKQPPILAPTLP